MATCFQTIPEGTPPRAPDESAALRVSQETHSLPVTPEIRPTQGLKAKLK